MLKASIQALRPQHLHKNKQKINKGEKKNNDKRSVNFLSDSPIFYVDRIFGYWKNCSNRVRIDHLILITSLVSGIFCVSVAPFAIIIFETFCFHYFCDPWMCFEYWYVLRFIWVLSISYFFNRVCSFRWDYCIYVFG